jgi:hypothetical protein
VTQRRALGGLDSDSAFDDLDDGWFGHVPAADRPVDAGPVDAEDTDRWPVPAVDPEPQPTRVPGARHRASTPVTVESRPSSSGTWDFKPSQPGARTRSKVAMGVLVAAVLALASSLFLLRSPGPAVDHSTVDSPNQPTGQLVPTTAAPALSTAGPAPLPPAPPAPFPSAEQITPPVSTGGYSPRRQDTPENKPEIGVTRTPVTRTQLSAKPPAPPAPDRNSSTPGDGRRGGGFGFGF